MPGRRAVNKNGEGSLLKLHWPSWLGEAVPTDASSLHSFEQRELLWKIGRYCASHFRQHRNIL